MAFFDRDPLKSEEYQEQNWYTLLVVTAVIFLIALGMHYAFYQTVTTLDGTVLEDNLSEDTTTLNREGLERALQLYQKREDDFARALVATSTLVDPSR